MKKYTQPTVEITAFDFEDITMSTTTPTPTPSVENMGAGYTAGSQFATDAAAGNYNVVEW